MVSFPNCKINLGLHVIRKREDGYHDIETVFYPLLFHDVIEVVQPNDVPSSIPFLDSSTVKQPAIQKDIEPGEGAKEYPAPTSKPEFEASNLKPNASPTGSETSLKLFTSGLHLGVKPEENICVKAFQLLKKDFPDLPFTEIYLHKAIPIGAGLGGGSADGAFMLKLINEKFELSLSTNQLLHYALNLGSDCPFFIINKPCIATGRGEVLKEIVFSLSSYQIVIVNPGIHIPTSWAFSHIPPAEPSKLIWEIIRQPVETWKDELKNDFENIVFRQYPEIETIKNSLYKEGAVFSLMSGSGSSVYGIFKAGVNPRFNFPSGYFVKTLEAV